MSGDDTTVWVLLRQREGSEDTTVHLVAANRDVLERRLANIEKQNPYPLRSVGENSWRIGPDEDEGFFGNKAVTLRAVEKKMVDR
jgi:hypothetical protein